MLQWAKEAEEAERLEKMIQMDKEANSSMDDLALAIRNKNSDRAAGADAFFDNLLNKYAKKSEKSNKRKSGGVVSSKAKKH